MIYTCRWLLPIDRRPREHAWIEIAGGLIQRVGQGPPPGPAVDLGNVALLPGLVNAHTHLELSWLDGLVPPAESMDAWIRALMARRGAGAPGGATAEQAATLSAIAAMQAAGTVLVGDVSNTLAPVPLLAAAGLGGVVFHELIGFNPPAPSSVVADALARLRLAESGLAPAVPLRFTIAAHAPYSVSPALFREIAFRTPSGPLAVHLGESPEEIRFLGSGQGPLRRLLDSLGAWDAAWEPPMSGPVAYLDSLGYLRHGTLAVHGVHLTDRELDQLQRAGAVLVTCPRSNLWVGAGMPRVSHFYASGVPVAIGTDSLASVPSLNMFDELAELRRIAPDVAAASLLESATRIGAEALGFGASYGTLAPGKVAAFVAVDVPADVGDVEEYLVGGIPSSAVRLVS